MILEGKIDLAVPAAKAWDFIMDVERFASCLPGLEQVTAIDERTFDGVVGAAVGPISGKFNFRATILESAPPADMRVRIEGTDSVTKSAVSANLTVKLAGIEAGTQLGYHADIRIDGRLAILGDMVLRAASALALEEFARRLKEKLEG